MKKREFGGKRATEVIHIPRRRVVEKMAFRTALPPNYTRFFRDAKLFRWRNFNRARARALGKSDYSDGEAERAQLNISAVASRSEFLTNYRYSR